MNHEITCGEIDKLWRDDTINSFAKLLRNDSVTASIAIGEVESVGLVCKRIYENLRSVGRRKWRY